jgi:hypothetical protein
MFCKNHPSVLLRWFFLCLFADAPVDRGALDVALNITLDITFLG